MSRNFYRKSFFTLIFIMSSSFQVFIISIQTIIKITFPSLLTSQFKKKEWIRPLLKKQNADCFLYKQACVSGEPGKIILLGRHTYNDWLWADLYEQHYNERMPIINQRTTSETCLSIIPNTSMTRKFFFFWYLCYHLKSVSSKS